MSTVCFPSFPFALYLALVCLPFLPPSETVLTRAASDLHAGKYVQQMFSHEEMKNKVNIDSTSHHTQKINLK